MIIEAVYIIVTFAIMGMLAGLLASGTFSASGTSSMVIYAAYVLCMLFDQFNMVHSFLMREIAENKAEVTNTLSVGVGVDHIMAVIASPVLGLVWEGMGVQYVFYIAAASTLLQVAAAYTVRRRIE